MLRRRHQLPRRRLPRRAFLGGGPSRPALETVTLTLPSADVLEADGSSAGRLTDGIPHWVKRLEQRTSHWLSAHVFPRVPGLAAPYSRRVHRSLQLSEAVVEVADWPASAGECRLLLLTDLHAGPFVTAGALEEVVAAVLPTEPHAILLGGDLVTARADELDLLEPLLRALEAPLGVWAVLGNHEHATGRAGAIGDRLESWGVGWLDNRGVDVETIGAGLHLAGIDDWLMGEPDLDAALAAAPADAPCVLLSHNPDAFFQAARAGARLVLSGHTHGGQICRSDGRVVLRQSRHGLDEGRFRNNGSELIVSRGIGVTGLPLRHRCPPEAVLVRLVPKASG